MPDNEEKLILSADNSKLVSGIDQAVSKLKSLDSAVGKTDAELRKHDRVVDSVSSGLQRLSQSAKDSASSTDKATSALGRYGASATATLGQLRKLEAAQDKLTGKALGEVQLPASLGSRNAAGQFTGKTDDVSRLSINEAEALDRAYKLQRQSLESLNAERLNSFRTATENARATTVMTKAEAEGAKGADNYAHSLSTARYALHDVSTTIGVTGLAMVGLAAATFKTSIDMERDFQAIVRTTGAVGPQIDYLRKQFIGLSQDIPVSFADLTDIGALGGQLGVAAKDLAGFTETVAQFSATTDVTVEASATAFGRLDSLLPDVKGNYEALGSSILKVGVNSVATESGIINTAQQIASMAQIAKISAPNIIGLAGALASLGIPPELSRSVITSTFTKIVSAVNSGGAALDAFGAASKMSGAEFAAAWQKDSIGTFQRLLQGIDESGAQGINVLSGLGLASQRLTPTLLKLAQNGDLLTQTLRDGNSGFADQSELQRQFAIIAGTTSAKLQVLAQNFQALLYELGQGGNVLGGLIDGLTGVLKIATDLAGNPVTNFMLQFGVAAMGVVGVLALVLAAAARATAGFIAVRQSLLELNVISASTPLTMQGVTAAMIETGGASRAAAVGVRVLSAALKLLTLVGAAVAVGEIGTAIVTAGLEASGATTSVEKLAQKLADTKNISKTLTDELGRTGNIFGRFENIDTSDVKGSLKELASFTNDFQKEFVTGWNATTNRVQGNVNTIDDALEQMVAAGNIEGATQGVKAFGDQWGLSGAEVKRLLDDTTAALELNAGGLSDNEKASQRALAATAAYADGMQITTEQLTAMQEALVTGSSRFTDFGTILNGVQEDNQSFAEAQAAATASSEDSWTDFTVGTEGLLGQFTAALDESIAQQSSWADNLSILAARGATGFTTELAKLGPESADLAAQAVNLTDDELRKLEDKAKLAAFLSSQAFAETFTANTPTLIAAYRTGGISAVQAAISAMNGETAVNLPSPIQITAQSTEAEKTRFAIEQAINATTATLKIDANTSKAQTKFQSLVSGFNATIATLATNITGKKDGGIIKNYAQGGQIKGGLPSFATGGYGKFKGPGTGTSDSMLARVSNGEYINTAATVRHYGADFFDALNRRQLPQYAEGGSVGQSSAPAQVVAHLSPRDRASMNQKGDIVIQVDGIEIARAVNRANAESGATGSN